MIFSTFCLLFGIITLNVNGASIPSLTLYDVIAKNCANLNLNDTSFKNQTVFQKCKVWTDIDKTNQLSTQTESNVLCLLYYDSFISFCTDLKAYKAANITINLIPDLKDLQINTICKNLALFPANKKFEHNINNIISDEGVCYKLCENYDKTLVTECGLAYYFLNSISQLNQGEVPSSKLLVESPETKTVSLGQQAQFSPVTEVSKAQSNVDTENNSHVATQTEKKEEKSPNEKQVSEAELDLIPVKSPPSPNVTPENKNNLKQTSSSAVNNLQPTPSKSGPITDQSNVKAADANALNVNAPDTNTRNEKVDSSVKGKLVEQTSISEPNPQDTISKEGQQPPDNGNRDDTDLTIDQLSSMNQPGPDEQEMEDEEINEGNFNISDKEDDERPENVDAVTGEKKKEKPNTLTLAGELPANYNTAEDLDGESYFFSYFMVICVLFVLGYVGYHNRQKVMALVLEGKRGKRQVRGRRPNSANYHKLDSNLEEAISSSCTKNSSHVIY